MIFRFPKKPLKQYGIKPDELFLPGVYRWPSEPLRYYGITHKEFFGGTDRVTLSEFIVAVRKSCISSSGDFELALKDGRLVGLPRSVQRYFGDEWPGWEAVLGRPAPNATASMSFAQFRKAIRRAGIASENDYRLALKNGRLIGRFPTNPQRTFRKEWRGWPHALGRPSQRPSLTITLAEFIGRVRQLRLRSGADYDRAFKNGTIKRGQMPSSPEGYFGKAWPGWAHVTGYVNGKGRVTATFQQCIATIRKLKLKTKDDYRLAYSDGRLPQGMPADPAQVYKSEWKGWPHALGKTKK